MPWQIRTLNLWDVFELLNDGQPAAAEKPAATPIANVVEAAWQMRDEVFRRAAKRAGLSPAEFAVLEPSQAAGWLKAETSRNYPADRLAPVLAEWRTRLE